MIQRKTQTAEYWQSFSLTPDDLDFLRNHMLDAERPLSTTELALALVSERCRREETELRADLSRGTLYQPKKRFAVNDKLIFPALGFRLGEVTNLRPGENPEYGAFDVISVDFGPNRRQRTFAAGLEAPHKLNADVSDMLVAGDLVTPEKLMETSAENVPAALEQALAEQPAFTHFEDRWLLKDLQAEVHVGHLNIAEAMIDMHATAVETETLVRELELPSEIPQDIVEFSLQSALAADGRFDQVGQGDERRWFLRRLEPEEALVTPAILRYRLSPYDSALIPGDLRQLAFELDDEWSESFTSESLVRSATPSATVLLIYPHLVSGTLPLNRRSRPFFKRGHGERTMVTLIDGRWGNRFAAWLNHQGRYIAGLQAWYEKHKLPAGAFIVLERRDSSGEIVVDFRPKRMRREWTRWGQIGDGERVDIQLRKQEISCEYDEQVVIGGDEKNEDLRKLLLSPHYADMALRDLVFELFTDLAGLSQQGTVHAKTIYSAVNVVRRCPPEPIFATLASDNRLEKIGDGSFRLTI